VPPSRVRHTVIGGLGWLCGYGKDAGDTEHSWAAWAPGNKAQWRRHDSNGSKVSGKRSEDTQPRPRGQKKARTGLCDQAVTRAAAGGQNARILGFQGREPKDGLGPAHDES
jgi:hypothetical protein